MPMDAIQRTELWDQYFEASFRARYFLELADRLKSRTMMIALAIGVLSCVPLLNLLTATGQNALTIAAGAAAGVLGVYLAVGGIAAKMSAAISAARDWNAAAVKLRALWTRYEHGADIASDYEAVTSGLVTIDNYVIEKLDSDRKLIERAWQATEKALATA